MEQSFREDFLGRLRACFWAKENDGFVDWLEQLFAALLDTDDWESDAPDETFLLDGEVYREGGGLAIELYHCFVHQNTRYARSLRVVPFLGEMLPRVAPHNQAHLVLTLLDIALGCPQWHYEHGFDAAQCRGSYMTEEQGIAMHDAVERHAFPEFLKMARNADLPARTAALYALAWFPARATEAAPILEAAQNEPGLVGQTALFALVMLKRARLQKPGLVLDSPPDEFDEFIDLQRVFFG